MLSWYKFAVYDANQTIPKIEFFGDKTATTEFDIVSSLGPEYDRKVRAVYSTVDSEILSIHVDDKRYGLVNAEITKYDQGYDEYVQIVKEHVENQQKDSDEMLDERERINPFAQWR